MLLYSFDSSSNSYQLIPKACCNMIPQFKASGRRILWNSLLQLECAYLLSVKLCSSFFLIQHCFYAYWKLLILTRYLNHCASMHDGISNVLLKHWILYCMLIIQNQHSCHCPSSWIAWCLCHTVQNHKQCSDHISPRLINRILHLQCLMLLPPGIISCNYMILDIQEQAY